MTTKSGFTPDQVLADITKHLGPKLAARVTHRRQALGISQARLAMAIGMPRSEVQKIEDGELIISTTRMELLAEALKTTRAWLMTGK